MRTIHLAVAASLAAALAAAPSLAQQAPANDEIKVNRVIVLTRADKDGKPGDTREIRLRANGGGPLNDIILTDCDGEKTEVNQSTGNQKTKIIYCGKAGMTGEERARKLEELRAKLAQGDHLGAEHRASVDAALQEAINQARAGK